MPSQIPSRSAVLIALFPFAAMCFSVALWDRVDPTILGMPFNLAWLLLWIVLSSVCLRVVYRMQVKRSGK